MAEIRALRIGLSTPLDNGAKVFGVLSKDGDCTCFELTAPDGIVTRFALTDDALAAMVDVSLKLRERNAGVLASQERFEVVRSIIYDCPALKLPQTFLQKLGMTAQIVPLRGLTQEQAEAIVNRLNAGVPASANNQGENHG